MNYSGETQGRPSEDPKREAMAATGPTVTAVIPAYNGSRFIREAIDSALAQTWQDIEVLVVDDGSTDETPAILAAYGARIRVIRKPNGGTGSALNAGIRAARGAWIAWLSQDDAWEPNKIERQLEAVRMHPGVGLVYSDYWQVDEEGRVVGRFDGACPAGRVARILRLIRRMYINANSTLIPRTVFGHVGYYDESETAVDLDMFLRILDRYDILRVPEPLLRYRLHPGQVTKRPFTRDRVVARALRRLGGAWGASGAGLHLAVKIFWLPMYVQKGSHPEKRPLRALLASAPEFLRLLLDSTPSDDARGRP